MHIGERIKNIIDKMDNVTNKKVADSLGFSENYMYKLYKKSSLHSNLIEKIADVIGISPSVFFEEEINLDKNIMNEKVGKYKLSPKKQTKVIIQIELYQEQAKRVLEMVFGQDEFTNL